MIMESETLNSYLSDKYQFVSTNGSESDAKTIKYGVPQGSVFLLLLYIDDLQNSIKSWIKRHFIVFLVVNSSLRQLKNIFTWILNTKQFFFFHNQSRNNKDKIKRILFFFALVHYSHDHYNCH